MGKDHRALGERCCVSQGGATRFRQEGEERRRKRNGGWWNGRPWKRRGREGEEKVAAEDAWSEQDRRANGGHRTEMASGSAFQYSTLATLGHPLLLLSLAASSSNRLSVASLSRSSASSSPSSASLSSSPPPPSLFLLAVTSFALAESFPRLVLLCHAVSSLSPMLSILLWTPGPFISLAAFLSFRWPPVRRTFLVARARAPAAIGYIYISRASSFAVKLTDSKLQIVILATLFPGNSTNILFGG